MSICTCMTAVRSTTFKTSVQGALSYRLIAASRIHSYQPTSTLRRMQSTTSAASSQPSSSKVVSSHELPSGIPPAKGKKPSPYRLLTPDQRAELLPPLQAQGWSVRPLPSQTSETPPKEATPQQQELVGSFQFTHLKGKAAAQAAWRETLRFTATVGDIIETEDHHPTLTITPSGCSLGFIVQIQTHTHAPLPSTPGGEKPPPNLTRKDISLASLISAAYERTNV